jgi:hypothetical protein
LVLIPAILIAARDTYPVSAIAIAIAIIVIAPICDGVSVVRQRR